MRRRGVWRCGAREGHQPQGKHQRGSPGKRQDRVCGKRRLGRARCRWRSVLHADFSERGRRSSGTPFWHSNGFGTRHSSAAGFIRASRAAARPPWIARWSTRSRACG